MTKETKRRVAAPAVRSGPSLTRTAQTLRAIRDRHPLALEPRRPRRA